MASCDPASDRWVAFWVASMLRGRAAPLRELGRRCHDSVDERAGGVDAAAGDLVSTSKGVSFSLVGEESGGSIGASSLASGSGG